MEDFESAKRLVNRFDTAEKAIAAFPHVVSLGSALLELKSERDARRRSERFEREEADY